MTLLTKLQQIFFSYMLSLLVYIKYYERYKFTLCYVYFGSGLNLLELLLIGIFVKHLKFCLDFQIIFLSITSLRPCLTISPVTNFCPD